MPPLPNFLIVGAMRSGTTSLTRYFEAHPDVFMSRKKEIHYFDFNFERGDGWYLEHFASARGQTAIGEATPSYMYVAEAAPRMAALVPEARLIAILREPVERAYSHYWHERSLRRERLSFEAAIEAEPSRLRSSDPVARARYAYLDRGRYVHQLRRLERHYGRERMHVLLLDDLRADADAAYRAICRFLGVADDLVHADVTVRHNRGRPVRSMTLRRIAGRFPLRSSIGRRLRQLNRAPEEYRPLDPARRDELRRRFRDDNEELARWLGRDLSAWNAGATHEGRREAAG